jgi:hypothetical protein
MSRSPAALLQVSCKQAGFRVRRRAVAGRDACSAARCVVRNAVIEES